MEVEHNQARKKVNEQLLASGTDTVIQIHFTRQTNPCIRVNECNVLARLIYKELSGLQWNVERCEVNRIEEGQVEYEIDVEWPIPNAGLASMSENPFHGKYQASLTEVLAERDDEEDEGTDTGSTVISIGSFDYGREVRM